MSHQPISQQSQSPRHSHDRSRRPWRAAATVALASAVAATAMVLPGAGPASAAPGTITAVAGGQPANGAPATSFKIRPNSVATFATTVYASDTLSHVVWRLDTTTGTMAVAAGTGAPGYNGDGRPATAATLNEPYGLATDVTGNLYIADRRNHRVRKVDATTQTITTVAGTGGTTGCPLLSDHQRCLDGHQATTYDLPFPTGLATDSTGNLYLVSGSKVLKVDSAGTLTTVAGANGSGFSGDGGPAVLAKFDNPSSLAVDTSDNLFIADTANYRVRRVDTATGIITTVAGNGTYGSDGDGGPATSAQLGSANGLAISAGNLYIAQSGSGNHRIRRVDSAGTITTVAGNGTYGSDGDGGPAAAARLGEPDGVAVGASGDLFIADWGNHRLRRVDPATQVITTTAGTGTLLAGLSGDEGPAALAQLSGPGDTAADAAGNLYIADGGNYRVRKVDPSGVITTYAGGGTDVADNIPATSAQLWPGGVDLDAAGNLYISNVATSDHRVRKVDASGIITTVAGTLGNAGFSGDGGPATEAKLNHPGDVAVDGAGNLFIADTYNSRVRRVDAASGIITTVAGNGEPGFGGDGGAATAAKLNGPGGVAIDSAGNLVIADSWNNRIRRLDSAGIITTVAGNGNNGYNGDGLPATSASLSPARLDIDAAGNLFIADSSNNRVRQVDAATNKISTVAGGGTPGFVGNGGPATAAMLNEPSGVGLDPSGNLYIADTANHGVRKVEGAGVAAVARVASVADFGGDARTDHAVFRPSDGTWYAKDPATGATTAISYGVSGDVPTPADFDGDKKADAAVYRPTEGTWYVRNSSDGSQVATPWGTGSDIAVPADYDGDAKADVAVYRPEEGTWYVRRSSDGAIAIASWGADGDIPVVGDYDGDNRADHAVFRPSEGTWYVRNSSNGATAAVAWGTSGDVPTPGDFDGDTKADKAVYRPSEGTWYVKNTTGAPDTAAAWGGPDDIPVPGNFDDDAKADIAVFRPTEGTWYVVRSSDGAKTAAAWGAAGDVPLPLPDAIGRFFS